MELIPIIEIIEVDCIARGRRVVRDAIAPENALARGIVVDITADGAIELVGGALVELGSRLLLDPAFELSISRALRLDVIDDGILVQCQRVEDHLVVAFADAGITGGEQAALLKGNLQPKP